MHLFEIVAPESTVVSVFAENYHKAAEFFTVWWMSRYDADLPDFEVKRRNPQWPGLNRQQLVEALSQQIAGVGRYDVEKGWVILPPNHIEEELV